MEKLHQNRKILGSRDYLLKWCFTMSLTNFFSNNVIDFEFNVQSPSQAIITRRKNIYAKKEINSNNGCVNVWPLIDYTIDVG